jgi:formylglycine-generating enzyme required for sulfatase activity
MKALLSSLLILAAILTQAPRESHSDQSFPGSEIRSLEGKAYLSLASASSSSMYREEDRRSWTEPYTGMSFVWVPGGCYEMGCGRWTDECKEDEKPVHEVCVDGFWFGKYEVTQAEWTKVMQNNPSRFKKGDNYPVENVSWKDIEAFIEQLGARSETQFVFRLPTEAEWEFACRSAGKAEKFAGGRDVNDVAFYIENSDYSTQPVGTKQQNGLGLNDMSGNVMEWCMDTYNERAYSLHERTNPVHIGGETKRVCRGGGWDFRSGNARCSHRCRHEQSFGDDFIGFRLVRVR